MFAIAKLLGTSALAALLLAGGAIAKDVPSRITISDDETSIFVVETKLRALGFDAVQVIDQRGRIFHVSAMWDGQPQTLVVDARRESIIVPSAAMAAEDGGMPRRVALFGDTTATYTVVRTLETIGFEDVEVTDKRGAVFDVTALWDDAAVRLHVDADLGASITWHRLTRSRRMPCQIKSSSPMTTQRRT